jgi:putative endonuclease
MERPTRNTRARGRVGEVAAEAHLRRRGFRILARNVHVRHGEVDLVAMEGATLCFVEVRLRSSDRYGTPAESVDGRKRRRLVRAAAAVLARGGLPRYREVRFDVVSVRPGSRGPQVELLRDAFRPGENS